MTPLWIADSGATSHMTTQLYILSNFEPFRSPQLPPVNGIGESQLFSAGRGDVKIYTLIEGKTEEVTIRNVFYVPDLGVNLLSIPAVTKIGIAVKSTKTTSNSSKIEKSSWLDADSKTNYMLET